MTIFSHNHTKKGKLMAQEIVVYPGTEITVYKDSDTIFDEVLASLLKRVPSKSTKRLYTQDVTRFKEWLKVNQTSAGINRDLILDYQNYLTEHYSKNTASRMFIVARKFLEEAVIKGVIPTNPATKANGVDTLKTDQGETPHRALSKTEARELFDQLDRSTKKGLRDYAIMFTLVKTGIRRAELCGLVMADMTTEQGHNILVIRHGKGNKRRIVKLQVECYRAILDYLQAVGRENTPGPEPLFVQFRKSDIPTALPIGVKAVERLVIREGKKLGGDVLTPHGLRATYVTLALEGGASLYQTQYAVGHSDPRTTERYQRRKLNLDDNASDYVKF
jgi:site-specific recombinase XerD